jgi:hypothetical protein
MRRNNLLRSSLPILFLVGFVLLVGPTVLAAPAEGASRLIGRAASPAGGSFRSYVQPYFFPSYGGFGNFGFGGFYSPFVNLPTLPPAVPYLPKYWWAEPYPTSDPRQSGYNPSSGYSRDSVTTLLLLTYPVNSRIVLDGIDVGRANYLGPIQLPVGEHTLRVEAPGFEPSETVLNVEEPVLQQLEVRLKRAPAQAESKQDR